MELILLFFSGFVGIFRQSSHPLALFSLYLFRTAAVAVYILCGFFTDNYVLSVGQVFFSLRASDADVNYADSCRGCAISNGLLELSRAFHHNPPKQPFLRLRTPYRT